MPLQLITRNHNTRNLELLLFNLLTYVLNYTPLHPDLKNSKVLLNYNILEADLGEDLDQGIEWYLGFQLDNNNINLYAKDNCIHNQDSVNINLYVRIPDNVDSMYNNRTRIDRILDLLTDRLCHNADTFTDTVFTQLDTSYTKEQETFKCRLSQNFLTARIVTPETVNQTNYYTGVLNLTIKFQKI
jgi:hypothetical protein